MDSEVEKLQKVKLLFKYQSRINNDQKNFGVNRRGKGMRWNNNLFLLLNVIHRKTSPYGSGVILR